MNRPANIDHYMATSGTNCAYCQYGRHNYKKLPDQCKECSLVVDRDKPYMGLIPVWKEGHVPTKAENKAAFNHITKILKAAPDCYPRDYQDGVTGISGKE